MRSESVHKRTRCSIQAVMQEASLYDCAVRFVWPPELGNAKISANADGHVGQDSEASDLPLWSALTNGILSTSRGCNAAKNGGKKLKKAKKELDTFFSFTYTATEENEGAEVILLLTAGTR